MTPEQFTQLIQAIDGVRETVWWVCFWLVMIIIFKD